MTRLRIRYLTSADIPFADSLRALAGWNQTPDDWQRAIDLSPRGCLLAECEGRPVATATTITYGAELGWIGMMLVHPDFRRRGIARVLMQHSIEILQSTRVRLIKLDATPAGREVYLRVGFKDEYTITRFQHDAAAPEKPTDTFRRATTDDFQEILELDHAASGVDRKTVLTRLFADSADTIINKTAGQITGFGLRRRGSVASYLGPIVATNTNDGQRIASALAAGKTFCDLLDHHPTASAWAKSQGFAPQRTLTRMYLGENVAPIAPQNYFAIAAPDLG